MTNADISLILTCDITYLFLHTLLWLYLLFIVQLIVRETETFSPENKITLQKYGVLSQVRYVTKFLYRPII